MKTCALFLPFVFLAAFAISACGDKSPTGVTTGTAALRITGSWMYSADAMDAGMMATCHAQGTLSFSQTDVGDQFGGGLQGLQSCIDGGVSTGNMDVIVPVTAGELAGAAAKFDLLGCTHMGTVTGSPPNRVAGTVTCSLAVTAGGTPRPFTGAWVATR